MGSQFERQDSGLLELLSSVPTLTPNRLRKRMRSPFVMKFTKPAPILFGRLDLWALAR
jgi:hypothetical protein